MFKSSFFDIQANQKAQYKINQLLIKLDDLLERSKTERVSVKEIMKYHEQLYKLIVIDNHALTQNQIEDYTKEFNKIGQVILEMQADASHSLPTEQTPLTSATKEEKTCHFCRCM